MLLICAVAVGAGAVNADINYAVAVGAGAMNCRY